MRKRRIDMTDIELFGEDITRKFLKKVEKSDGCWMWKGTVINTGYGVFSWSSTTCLAHRLSYMLHVGEIEKRRDAQESCVCHHCDVKLCVRPDHLFVGTHKENVQDLKRKGKGQWAKKQTS